MREVPRPLGCQGFLTVELIALADRAVVETEEVYQLVQELRHADSRDIHRAAQRPEEVVFHADGELVAPQPERARWRGRELGDAAAHAGELPTQQLLFV